MQNNNHNSFILICFCKVFATTLCEQSVHQQIFFCFSPSDLSFHHKYFQARQEMKRHKNWCRIAGMFSATKTCDKVSFVSCPHYIDKMLINHLMFSGGCPRPLLPGRAGREFAQFCSLFSFVCLLCYAELGGSVCLH